MLTEREVRLITFYADMIPIKPRDLPPSKPLLTLVSRPIGTIPRSIWSCANCAKRAIANAHGQGHRGGCVNFRAMKRISSKRPQKHAAVAKVLNPPMGR